MRGCAIAVLLTVFVVARCEAGGPDLQMKSCAVDRVEADDDKIVFTVSGLGKLALYDPDQSGKVRFVEARLERCVISILRKDIPPANLTGSWADNQARAKALAGKTAMIEVGGSITVERTLVAAVRCEWAHWAPAR